MEFPDLGAHCSESTCNRLDFLPMQCDACEKMFCASHFHYDTHNCLKSGNRDHQVPLCPLCGVPVPTAPGEEPDRTVSDHIDRQCQSDSTMVFTYLCTFNKCKGKELVPFKCLTCEQNFCARHRHAVDHNCKKDVLQNKQIDAIENAKRLKVGEIIPTLKDNIVVVKAQKVVPNSAMAHAVQGSLTDDEAFAEAIAQSMQEMIKNSRAAQSQIPSSKNTFKNNNEKCVLS